MDIFGTSDLFINSSNILPINRQHISIDINII